MNTLIREMLINISMILVFIILGISGCGKDTQTQTIEKVKEEKSELPMYELSDYETDEITKICEDIYNTIEKDNKADSLATVRNIVNQLGEKGYVAVDCDNQIDMTKADQVMQFCKKVDAKKTAEITIIIVSYQDDFIRYNLKTQDGNVDIERSYYKYENGYFEKKSTDNYSADMWQYTNEGYLIFDGNWYCEESYVLSLSDVPECTASKLSYVNYNMLVTDWDKNNVEDILMPCMFEDIYRIYTGENLKAENDRIPADVYEKIMTTCFPVSVEQLHENCEYDENTNSYKYEMIYAEPFPPFGEVVDYTQNSDGTITLFVDGVWVDFDSDCAFTNKIVVQPFDDGTFRYLSNAIEQKELQLPAVERMNQKIGSFWMITLVICTLEKEFCVLQCNYLGKLK